MAGSLIVAVRKALVAGLDADAGLAGVQVTYGWPGDDEAERERIFTNGGRATHDSAAMKAGRNFRNEVMEFDVILQVEGVGLDPEDTDERAIVLGQVIEEYVADHKNSLGVTGLNWISARGTRLTNLYNERGSLSELTLTVAYHARLT